MSSRLKAEAPQPNPVTDVHFQTGDVLLLDIAASGGPWPTYQARYPSRIGKELEPVHIGRI